MHRTRTLAALAALLLVVPALASDPEHPAPPDPPPHPDIRADEILHTVAWLADDARGGRETTTPGCEAAADWLAGEVTALGLETLEGAPGHLWPWTLPWGEVLPAASALATVADSGGTPFQHGEDWRALAGAGDGAVEGEVVFAGYGIQAPDLEWDDYAGLDVAGRVVLLLRHEPHERDATARRWNGQRATRHSAFITKAVTAQQAGAAAVIIVNDPLNHAEDALDSRAFGLGTGPVSIPVVLASRRVAATLLAGQDLDLEALQRMIDEQDRPASRPLPGTRVRLEVAIRRPSSTNVVAFLPGADPALADETVIIGAHYDHVGTGEGGGLDPRRWGEIHNGADDNASGSAALLAVAEHFALTEHRPRRSLLFLWFSGEEKGLLGSRAWTGAPLLPLDKAVAMINLDMVGRYRPGAFQVVGAASGSTLKYHVAAAVEGLDLEIEHTNQGMANSDGLHFHDKGVPTLFLFSGLHDDYHRPDDDWWKVDAEATARIATLAARLARRLADTDEKPDYREIPRREMRMARGGNRVVLGVTFANEPGRGVALAGIAGGSPAARAGLRPGDRVLAFGGTAIESPAALVGALQRVRPGQTVACTILRDGQEVTLEVSFAPPPSTGFVLGVVMGADDEPAGVLLEEIAPGSAAARAGLRAGDRILAWGGTATNDSDTLTGLIADMERGMRLILSVRRGEETLQLTVTYPEK